jgi:hypothetical protein
VTTAAYTDGTTRLADAATAKVTALLAAYQAGQLTVDQFKTAAVQVMVTMMSAAGMYADQALAAYLSQQTGKQVTPVGVVGVDAAARLSQAFDTVLASTNASMSAGRLANAEVLASAQSGWGAAMQRQPYVNGWTRQTKPGACDICQRLTGSVLSLSTPIYHHPGCNCTQRPVLNTEHFT